MSNYFQTFLQATGIISQRSCPSTPQQNGVAERKNRHLLDMVRALLIESSIPSHFWCEALFTAAYLINQLPSPTLNNVSPFHKLFGHHPTYSHLRTFGCVCFVHLLSHERKKLTPQSIRCAFLGYSTTQKGYVCYDPNIRRIKISRNVVFFEKQSFFTQDTAVSPPVFSVLPNFSTDFSRYKPGLIYTRRQDAPITNLELPSPTTVSPSLLDPPPMTSNPSPDDHPPPVTLRRSSRAPRPPDRYGFSSHSSLSATLNSITIPSSYRQAMEHECW